MKSKDVARRLAAVRAEKPLPSADTLPLAIANDEDLLIAAFVRMGGEALPWGVALAYPTGDAQIWCVPEPRDRDQVAAMLAELAPFLARHLQHPDLDPSVRETESAGQLPLRQLWLPNSAHVGMLHMLNLRYTSARRGPEDRIPLLNMLGRMCGWAFRDAQLPGHMTVVDAAAALRSVYVFPADDLRTQHLGYLLALVRTRGDLAAREAAGEEAEKQSVSITLDPWLERERLEPLINAYAMARDRGVKAAAKAAKPITDLIRAELERRVELVRNSIATLRADPRPTNEGVKTLVEASNKARLKDYVRDEELRLSGERAWHVPAVTDKPIPAAVSFFRLEAAHEQFQAALLHHDRSLQDESIAVGDAFRGEIISVRDEGGGRKRKPVWTVRAPGAGPLRLRARGTVCVAGLPSRTAVIREIGGPENGVRTFTVEITGLPTRPRGPAGRNVPFASDEGLVGQEVTMLSGGGGGFGFRKSTRAWDKDVPGGWLTHGHGAAPRSGKQPKGDVLAEVAKARTS